MMLEFLMHLLILGAVIPPVFSLCLYPWWWLFDNTKVVDSYFKKNFHSKKYGKLFHICFSGVWVLFIFSLLPLCIWLFVVVMGYLLPILGYE